MTDSTELERLARDWCHRHDARFPEHVEPLTRLLEDICCRQNLSSLTAAWQAVGEVDYRNLQGESPETAATRAIERLRKLPPPPLKERR